MSDVVRRIGGPNAVTWPGCFAALAFALFFGAAGSATARSSFIWIVPVTAGHFGAYGVLFLLRGRIAGPDPKRPRPGRAIAAFAGSAVVGSIASGIARGIILGRDANPSQNSGSPAVAITAGLATIVAFTVLASFSAVAVDAWREHTARSLEYRRSVDLLADLRAGAFDRLSAARDAVRQSIVTELDNLAGNAVLLPSDELRDRVRATALEVVRPLSHRLELESFGVDATPPSPQWSARTFLQDATTPRVFAPTTLAVLSVLPVALYAFLEGSAGQAAAASSLALVATALLAWGVDIVVRPAFVDGSPAARAVWWAAGVVAVAVAQAVIWTRVVDGSAGAQAATLAAFTVLFFGVTSPIWRAARTAFARELRESAALEADVARASAKMRQYEWATRIGLARLLHGQVQSALLALALRLGSRDSTDADTAQDRLMLTLTISNLVDALDDSKPLVDVATACGDIVTTWRGVCDVSFEPLPQGLLRADSTESSSFLAVVTEAVSNAVRHGSARRAIVSASDSASGDGIEVTVRSVGGRVNDDAQRQMGFSIFDSVTETWALESTDAGTLFSARLPMAPAGVTRVR